MGKKKHPLEAAFVDVKRITVEEGYVVKDFEVHSIPIPWSASDGLCVFDLFGGHEPTETEIPLPPGMDQMPPLRFTTSKSAALFLSQRWSDARIAKWEEAGTVGIDRAALCVTPRSLGPQSVETDPLEDALESANRPWCHLSAEGTDLIALKVYDDGSPNLYRALDKKGEVIGWVLDLADVELPWTLDEKIVPAGLEGFIKPQIRYAVAGRRTPTMTFEEVARAMKLPKSLAGGQVWDRSGIGDLTILEISKKDYHFYDQELQRVGIPNPESLFKVVFAYHYVSSVGDAEWRAMLGVMAQLARDTHGILYRLNGDDLLMHDFGSA